MRIPTLIGFAAAAALTGASLAPSAATTIKPMVMHRPALRAPIMLHRVVGPFANERMNQLFLNRPLVSLPSPTIVNAGIKCPEAYLFASDNKTGDLDVFCEDKPTALMAKLPVKAGWGLAVRPGNFKTLAVGVSATSTTVPGTISIYQNIPAGVLGAPASTLKLTNNGANAYGVCFDSLGGLYATEWPTNQIDYFSAALVTGPGGPPTNTYATNVNTEDYYVACDSDRGDPATPGSPGATDFIMIYGFNLNSTNIDADLTRLTPAGCPTACDTLETGAGTLGGYNTKNGFPGGLALNKKDNLLANNQYGTLYDLGKKEPWKVKKILSGCTWGFNPNDVVSISFDNLQNEVWGGDNNSGATYAETFAYPLPLGLTTPCKPGESGGPTTAITGENSYLGVAVYKNAGV